MTEDQHSVALPGQRVGGRDDALEQRLDDELTAFGTAATGTGRPEPLTVRVTDGTGALIGGLTAWTWGPLCAVDLLWTARGQRHAGWGSRLTRAAQEEGARRGCADMTVSSYTFQAPGFYRKLGFQEQGRPAGVPGGHEDVYFHQTIGETAARAGEGVEE